METLKDSTSPLQRQKANSYQFLSVSVILISVYSSRWDQSPKRWASRGRARRWKALEPSRRAPAVLNRKRRSGLLK